MFEPQTKLTAGQPSVSKRSPRSNGQCEHYITKAKWIEDWHSSKGDDGPPQQQELNYLKLQLWTKLTAGHPSSSQRTQSNVTTGH